MKPGAKSSARIFGPRFRSCQDPAAPPETASIIVFGSRPFLRAKRIASETARSVTPTRIWLQSLAICPLPAGPQ